MSNEKESKVLLVGGVNITVRLKNKTFLVALIAAIIGVVYNVLGMFDVVPAISESEIMQIVEAVLGFLVLIGVIQDPTTTGISDGEQGKTYVEPK